MFKSFLDRPLCFLYIKTTEMDLSSIIRKHKKKRSKKKKRFLHYKKLRLSSLKIQQPFYNEV